MIALLPLALALTVAQAQAPAAPAQPPVPQVAPPLPAATTTLTLDDALRISGERNQDLKVAAARLRQAEQGYWKAWAGYLPQLTLSGTYTRNGNPADLLYPFPVAPGVGEVGAVTAKIVEIPIIARNQWQGNIDATQVLFAPGLWFGIDAASSGTDAARAATENARRQILFGTAQAYYGVASLRRFTEVSQQLLEIQQRQEKDARVRYQAGTIAKVGLLRAEIDRARAEQDLQRARNAFQSARLALAQLLDRPADFDVVEPGEPRLPPEPAKLEEAALRDRADVKAARSQRDSAYAARRAQYGGYLPTVAAFWHWQDANVAGLTGAKLWAVGLAARWNILDGGLREANVREANGKVAEAEASLASTESKAKLEVGQALLDLDSARANAMKAKEQRDLAAENQRLVDVSYRAGSATAVEQADATAALRNAEISTTTETLSAQLAALRVLQAVGADIR